MIRPVLLVTLILLQPLATSAQDLQHVGDFHNVVSADGGEHCAGYSLGLWKYQDQLLGLLDVHQGLCGDPPCGVVRDVMLDPRTGRLHFWSSVNDQKFQFDGVLTPGAIDGVFNGQRASLAVDRNWMHSNFEPNRSMAAWCKFWISIPRCAGVEELCRSINAVPSN